MSTTATYEKNVALVRAYRDGDRAAGEELFLLNRPLLYHLAERFVGRGVEREELIECATVGLVKAINTFDTERGVTFSTYAVPLIMGEMRRFLRDDGMIKVSREEKKLCAILSAERERRQALGEDSSIGAIAAACGVSREDAACALFAMTPVRSLEEQAYDDDPAVTLGATLFDEDALPRELDHIALRAAIEQLPPLWQRLVLLRFFRDLSQSECARRLGITQVKVSREEKKLLEHLRKQLS